MRVLQLIDSLRPGGAEQMAVSYANALAKRINGSYLCCTRMEGMLKQRISQKVGYFFLGKNQALDMQAFWKLRKFVKENKIHLIQAHSSSWFFALLVKLSLPDVKLVWHDHYGRQLERRNPGLLTYASKYFEGIISVNSKLEQWARDRLNCKKVHYFRNFLPDIIRNNSQRRLMPLDGNDEDFKIICVANLRPQKDHLTLLRAFLEVYNKEEQVSLHLIGKDNEDSYSQKVKLFIRYNKLEEKVFLYGEQENVNEMLNSAALGVLPSRSEGLPVALLEYGQASLPVVCTNVGECLSVIGDVGIVIPPNSPKALAAGMLKYISDESLRKDHASRYHQRITTFFSEENIIGRVTKFYLEILE